MTGHQMNIYRHTKAIIHLQNLASNIQNLRQLIGQNQFFCPMVKANGYGHGDVEIALKLQELGVTSMGVSLIEEGLLLRQMGVQTQILVFGSFDQTAVSAVEQHKLTPVVGLWEQIEVLEKNLKNPISIHLKFDTGMHRLGFPWQEADQVFEYFNKKNSKLKIAGICTHLHSAEDASEVNGKSFEQLRRFQEVERFFIHMNPIIHTLNSAGMLNFIKMRSEGLSGLPGISLNQGVRPGLAIYGYSSLKYEIPGLSLKPVMSLRSEVIRYHQLHLGEAVSYGHTWRAGRESVIGIVPIGYADGVHRVLSNRGVVLFDGQKVPVVGNICMDFLMIDVTDVVQGRRLESYQNAEVTLFGYDSKNNLISVSEVAEKSQTIPWEILTSVGERVPRVIEDDFGVQSGMIKEVRV